MEYRRTENPAIPAEIMLGKYSTPVWIQSAWTEGEFAQYIRNNGYHYVLAVGIRADGKILIANSSENTTKGGVQWVTREQIAQSLYQGGEPNKSLTWGEIERFGQGCTYVVIDETEWTVSK